MQVTNNFYFLTKFPLRAVWIKVRQSGRCFLLCLDLILEAILEDITMFYRNIKWQSKETPLSVNRLFRLQHEIVRYPTSVTILWNLLVLVLPAISSWLLKRLLFYSIISCIRFFCMLIWLYFIIAFLICTNLPSLFNKWFCFRFHPKLVWHFCREKCKTAKDPECINQLT